MQNEINIVREFHDTYQIPAYDWPTEMSAERATLRTNIMQEEVKEFFHAAIDCDLIEMADALGDMLYVLIGTAHECGMANLLPELMAEIHRSNMSKLGADGKPIKRADGKVLKGPNYTKPDLKTIIQRAVSKSL